MTRHVFVGDVQGCRAELERLLERCAFDREHDVLHPVGDLVNRGPDSLGALRLLRELDARCVLGNHDVHLLRVARGLRSPGKTDTIDDVLAAADRDELLDWLAAQPFARRVGDWIQVHAGLDPSWEDPVAVLAGRDPLQPDDATEFATHVRACSATGERPTLANADEPRFAAWFEHLPRPAPAVVFGHWSARGLVRRPGLRGLDTGCVWGGRLTAWVLETDELFDVPAERTYCEPASSGSSSATSHSNE